MQQAIRQGARIKGMLKAVAWLIAFGVLTLAGLAFAQPTAQDSAAEAAGAGHNGQAIPFYRVVNLSPDAGSGRINAHGHVAFSQRWRPGPTPSPATSGWFYDGRQSRPIGSPGNPDGYAAIYGMNNHDQIVGMWYLPSGDPRVFIWSPRRPSTDLGTLPGTTRIWSPAINDRGVVAGSAGGGAADDPQRSFLFRWTATGGMEALGLPNPDLPGEKHVTAINNDGLLTGFIWNFGDTHAFVWTDNTGLIDIHTIDGSSYSSPIGVSAAGEVAGNYDLDRFGGSGFGARSFIWTRRDGMRNFDPLDAQSWATSINASGQVTGARITTAYTWTRAGGFLSLPTPAAIETWAEAANRPGKVVGFAFDRGSVSAPVRAVLWPPRAGMVDLNTRVRRPPAGLHLRGAVAISDNESILVRSNAGLILLKPDRGQAVPHAVGPIVAPYMTSSAVPVDVSVTIADDNAAARHRVTWYWGDGTSTQSASTRTRPGQWRASARHVFATAGTHLIGATVRERAGHSVSVQREVIVVAPDAGSVAGIGVFISPDGATGGPQRHRGPASISFSVPAPEGARSLPAQASLRFDVGEFAFRSTDIRPLLPVNGRGQFTGSGTVNGAGSYRFTLATTATDPDKGEPGRIRLKIWQPDPVTGKPIIAYDNATPARTGLSASHAATDAAGSALTEGRIVLN